MSRRPPMNFPDREPVTNDSSQTLSRNIVRGSSLFEDLTGWSGAYGGLMPPTEQMALTVTAIYACVGLIAGCIASLPFCVYEREDDGELTPLYDDDLWWIFNEEFSPRWSAATGWEFQLQSKLLRGDGFGKIYRNRAGTITGVEPLAYDRVTPIPTPDGQRLIYVVNADPLIPFPQAEPYEVLDQDDVLHYAGFGFNGVRGLSPLRSSLRMAAPVALAAQEYSARFFANGARPDYALTTEQGLPPETIEKLREQVEERHRGLNKAHRPMVLTHGLKPATLGIPADEMALLPTRQFSVEDLCRAYGVPPFMVGHTDKTTSWGSGVAEMGTGFVRYALRRHLNKIEVEANRKGLRRSKKVLKFDVSELEQADFKTLIEGFRTALGRAGEASFMTTEEIRERLHLKRKPQYGKLGQGTGNAKPAPAEPAGA